MFAAPVVPKQGGKADFVVRGFVNGGPAGGSASGNGLSGSRVRSGGHLSVLCPPVRASPPPPTPALHSVPLCPALVWTAGLVSTQNLVSEVERG